MLWPSKRQQSTAAKISPSRACLFRYCSPWTEPKIDERPAVAFVNLAPGPNVTGCCGAPAPTCSETPPPLSCLAERIPFGEPPACVKRRFHCCLTHWMKRFGVEETYKAAPTYVACKGKIWDVQDIGFDDVIFDQRSLMKLAAAFYPHIFVPSLVPSGHHARRSERRRGVAAASREASRARRGGVAAATRRRRRGVVAAS